MVALAFVGGLLVTLIYTLNYHLSLAQRQEFFTVASLLAKEKMAELEKNPTSTKGEFPEPYYGYHYVSEIKESTYPGMSEISVVVTNGKEDVRLMELIESEK